MTKKQIPTLVGALVTNQDEFSSLPTEDAQWAILNAVEAIALIVAALKNRAKATVSPLLELLGTIVRPATTADFVAKHHLTKDRFWLGDNFTNWFLGKVEGPQGAVTLRWHKLLKWLRDLTIIPELGGEEIAETTLTDIFWLIEQQKKGEVGTLLVNGYANIFYVRDIDNVLRAVSVHWHGGQWYWDAGPLGDARGWDGGSQVFSRNSVTA